MREPEELRMGRNVALDGEPRAEYHCDTCGYGVVAFGPPGTCPMCSGDDWRAGPRPAADGLIVKRLASSTFLFTPPAELDAGAARELAAAVADIAFEQPDVVVDLSHVRVLDESAAQLLLDVAALAHGAGGRLLAVCPRAYASGLGFHELAGVDRAAADTIGGPLGRALRALLLGRGAVGRA